MANNGFDKRQKQISVFASNNHSVTDGEAVKMVRLCYDIYADINKANALQYLPFFRYIGLAHKAYLVYNKKFVGTAYYTTELERSFLASEDAKSLCAEEVLYEYKVSPDGSQISKQRLARVSKIIKL